MSLSTPLALAWAALAIPLVIFYILKIRLRLVPVTTTLFWSQIYDQRQPRSLWQQLRHWLSLFVQLAFLILMVLALANPYWTWEQQQAERIVLVVDNSASMNAADGDPTRLDTARQHAHRQIGTLRARDEMAVLTAGGAPRIACGLTGHVRTLRTAIDHIAASDAPTRVPEAIELARRLLAGHPRGRIVVLSDGRYADGEQAAEVKGVEHIPIGGKTANLAITQFQVRRSLVDTIGYQILLAVENFSDEAIECRLEIDLNDQPVDVLPLKLAGGEAFSRTLDHVSSDGGRLVARLNHTDALAADNRAVAMLPRREMQRVWLITQGSHYLQRVLEAMPAVDLQVASVAPQPLPADSVVVYHRHTPATLPRGNVLVVDPANDSDAWTVGDELDNPLVGTQQSQSPLLTHVHMDNVWMPSARKLEFKRTPQILIAAVTGEPLYAAWESSEATGPQKLLVLSVDLEKGDLPLRTAFPILMTNALTWFQGRRGELQESLTTGSVFELDLATIPGDTPLVLRAPDNETRSLERPDERRHPQPTESSRSVEAASSLAESMKIGPLDKCGIWRIEAAAAQQPPSHATTSEAPPPALLELAVNLANPIESDLRTPREPASLPSLPVSGLGGRPLWYYLTLLGACLICFEWYLYQRRWIG